MVLGGEVSGFFIYKNSKFHIDKHFEMKLCYSLSFPTSLSPMEIFLVGVAKVTEI